ncbi:MAG: hydrogenase [Acidiphilium sp.]|nr:hydrogenase [Acidiphilium sp.]MDD4935098.1 hydrogenase [Acidiphilium sp.]
MSGAVARLLARPGVVALNPAMVDDFVATGTCVLLFTGDAARHKEIDDVATILPDLIVACGHAMRIGVIDPDADRASAIRFGVTIRPTLVFLHGGTVLGAVPRMKDWAVYLSEIATIFAPLAQGVS